MTEQAEHVSSHSGDECVEPFLCYVADALAERWLQEQQVARDKPPENHKESTDTLFR